MPTHAQALRAIVDQHNIDYPATATYSEWQNFAQNLYRDQVLIVQIDSIPQLQALMKDVNAKNEAILKENPSEPLIKVRGAAGWKDRPGETTFGWKFSNDRWANEQRKHYNESYSITPPAGEADIIIRFSPRFQKDNYKGNSVENPYQVTVPAGMQVGALATRLHHGAIPSSLSTISMIWSVSVIGLILNKGHGTGKLEGPVSESVTAIHLINHKGQYCIIEEGFISECERNQASDYVVTKKYPCDHFTVMRNANLGLYGIVVKVVLKVEPEFNLRENRYTYHDLDAANRDIPLVERLNKPYFTFMWMPANNLLTPNLEFREWSRTTGKDRIGAAVFVPGTPSRRQEMQIRINKVMNDYIYSHQAEAVLPIIQKLGAQVAIGLRHHHRRNPDVRQGAEYEITHYQVAFPSDLMDISMLFDVDEAKLPQFFEALYNETQRILKSDALKGKTPITYAVYARLLKGETPGQKTLAFEWVTHPEAPGLDVFLLALFTWINKNNIAQPRFHFGKFVPPHATFETFLGKAEVNRMRAALREFYGSDEAAMHSPFMTDYFKQKFQPGQGLRLPETLAGVQASLAPYQKATPDHRERVMPDQGQLASLISELSEIFDISLTPEEKSALGCEPVEGSSSDTEVEVSSTCFGGLKKMFC